MRAPDYAETGNHAHMSAEQRRQHEACLNHVDAKTGKPKPLPPPGHSGSPFAIAPRPVAYDEQGQEI